jgi:hypothetical protein
MLGSFAWDLLVVVSFVAFGRDTHNESLDLTRSFQTALPFLLALGVAWMPTPIRSRPAAVRSGLAIGATTALLGLILRGTVFNEGLSGAFPVIASLYLIGLIVLGRAVWSRLRRD